MSTDTEFDPEIHLVDAEGNPRKTKAGEYMKKRGPRKGTAPSPRRTSTAGRSTKTSGTDYRPGINGLFQMIAVPLAFTAPADAAAVGHHGPQIAEALNEVAKERPEVAAALEKVLSAGPYGLLIAAVVPLGVQIAHNHGLIPEQIAVSVGATPKRVIMEQLKDQAAQYDEEAMGNG